MQKKYSSFFKKNSLPLFTATLTAVFLLFATLYSTNIFHLPKPSTAFAPSQTPYTLYFTLNSQVGWETILIDTQNHAYYIRVLPSKHVIKKGTITAQAKENIANTLLSNNFFFLPVIYKEKTSLTEIPYRTLVVDSENTFKKVRVEQHGLPKEIQNIEEKLHAEMISLDSITTEAQAQELCQVLFKHQDKYKEEYQKMDYYLDGCMRSAREIITGSEVKK